MTKFASTTQFPETLDRREMVIDMPTFAQQIERVVRPSSVMTPAYLRTVLNAICSEFADENFNPYTLVINDYSGRPVTCTADVSAIVVELFTQQAPQIIEGYLEKLIKNRPMNVEVIYFTGPSKYTSVFYKNGIDTIAYRDIDVLLGRAEKKTVGKPFTKQSSNLEKPTTNEG